MKKSTPDPTKAFLGIGWAFPPQLQGDRTLSMAAYEEDIQQSIQIILGTNPGERVMRPDFGAGLNAFLFEPVSTTTLAMLENQVRTALIDWEPRIDVQAINVTPDETVLSKLLVEIFYQIRATNTQANLVYPFYLQEGSAT